MEIYKKEYGKDISKKEALRKATKLVEIYKLLIKALTNKNQHGK